MIRVRSWELSKNFRCEIGLDLIENTFKPTLVLKNNRGNEIKIGVFAYQSFCAYKNRILEWLDQDGHCQTDVHLDNTVLLQFVQFNGVKGLSIKQDAYFITFLRRSAHRLIHLKSVILRELGVISQHADDYNDRWQQIKQIASNVDTIEELLTKFDSGSVEQEIICLYIEQLLKKKKCRSIN